MRDILNPLVYDDKQRRFREADFTTDDVEGVIAPPKTLYLDGDNGNDSNDGTKERPLKTLRKAVDSMSYRCAEPDFVLLGGSFDFYLSIFSVFDYASDRAIVTVRSAGDKVSTLNIVDYSAYHTGYVKFYNVNFNMDLSDGHYGMQCNSPMSYHNCSFTMAGGGVGNTSMVVSTAGGLTFSGSTRILGNSDSASFFCGLSLSKVGSGSGPTSSISGVLSIETDMKFISFVDVTNGTLDVTNLEIIVKDGKKVTGDRFRVGKGGVINTHGKGINFFPGDGAGSASINGVYL